MLMTSKSCSKNRHTLSHENCLTVIVSQSFARDTAFAAYKLAHQLQHPAMELRVPFFDTIAVTNKRLDENDHFRISILMQCSFSDIFSLMTTT
jgi:hypothetical protein